MTALMETKTHPVALGSIFCFGDESVGKLLPCAVTVGLGRCRSNIKVAPSPHSLIHSSHLQLLGNKVSLEHFSSSLSSSKCISKHITCLQPGTGAPCHG